MVVQVIKNMLIFVLDEQKINLYAKGTTKINNPDNPKYVKLIPKSEKPCCFSSPGKSTPEKQIKNSNKSSTKIEKNILTNIDPIPLNRLGVIPDNLHNLLLDTIDVSECKTSLRKTMCYYRYGMEIIINNTESKLILSLLKVLNISSIDLFIKEIKNKLNFINFISLENGSVCKTFINKKIIGPYLTTWFPDNIDLPEEIKTKIYNSYIHYINYLSNINNINVQFLFSLISIVFNKILIIVLYRNNNTDILCSKYSSIFDLIHNLQDDKQDSIILFDNEGIYEPIVYKSNKSETFVFQLHQIPHLKKSIDLCNYNSYKEIFENITNYYNYIKIKNIKDYNQFKFKTILINSNLSISHIVLKSNYIISFEPLPSSYINYFINNFKIKHISLYDNFTIIDKIYNFDSETIKLWTSLLTNYNINYSTTLPNIYYDDAVLLYSTHEIQTKLNELSSKTKKYKEALIHIYDNKDLITTNKNEFFKSLSIKNIDLYKYILNEIDLNKIEDYINVFFLDDKITEDDKYLYFSGLAILNGIPDIINKTYKNKITTKENYNFSTIENNLFKFNMSIDMLLSTDTIKFPTKWDRVQSNKIYKKMNIIANDNYDKNSLYLFFNELITFKNDKNISIDTIKEKRLQNLQISLINYNLFNILLLEHDFKIQICKILSISLTTPIDNILHKFFNTDKKLIKSGKDIESYYDKIILNYDLYPNFLDISSASEILHITFLVIRYRALNADDKIPRYSNEDLANTASIYPKNKDIILKQPIILLYYQIDHITKISKYYIIKYENTIIYERYSDLHKDVQDIINIMCS